MLPKAPPLNPLSRNDSNPKMQQLDQFCRDISEQWESDHGKVMKREKKNAESAKEPMKEEVACSQSSMKLEEHIFVNKKHEKRGEEEKKMGSSHKVRNGEPCSQGANGGGYVLAQKMIELEMMDMTDVDHVLDIQEVLHHYSRLSSPVYLDIVDKFFMDMYSEFFLPRPSKTGSILCQNMILIPHSPLRFTAPWAEEDSELLTEDDDGDGVSGDIIRCCCLLHLDFRRFEKEFAVNHVRTCLAVQQRKKDPISVPIQRVELHRQI
ncbi:hypothetical protein F0562_022953 [Nyssa sinensis]|uniref:OVATE domain-containing protein n=1 Tax=Nyssa sinensis TaxID=561372 RepID=A0A5J5BKW6_9ASTE|nr:hypothetical protein F0562_022953 [Nyssa sinensis]